MKYSSKGWKDRNRSQEQNKKEWASSVGLSQKSLTSPPCEGEPARTLHEHSVHKDTTHFDDPVFTFY